jgi:lipoprotein-anchoring transpeptidase ErfK/SrfK
MGENAEIKKNKRGVYVGIACIITVACLMAVYFGVGLYYTNRIFDNVTINGVDVSRMTASQIREDLGVRAQNYTLLIKERNNKEEVIDGKDFDLQLLFTDALDEIFANQRIWEWGVHLFRAAEYDIEMVAEYDSDKLNSLISRLDCMDSDNMEDPTDAYLEYDEENGLSLIPDNKGTKIDKTRMSTAVTSAVESALSQLNLDEAGVYVAPKVESDDEDLNYSYNLLLPYLDMVITYHFDDEVEVLDRNTFYEWISETPQGTVEFDQDMIKDYVKSLASKHNTAYRKHELETSYGQTVTISTGSYGWIIDQTVEREELYDALKSCKSQDREPIYSQTAASHTGNDYGDTYVEVNLSAQHLFFYVDGKLLIETDFVSGNASKGWTTPGGIFPLTYKQRNATLKGETYSTPVSYWMPFNGNIGLHDSTWRSTYGKNIYKTNGSHGCINLPPSAAEVIFENIEKGMPVICYYLPGTEYKSSTPETGTVVEEEQEPTLTVDATPLEETPVEETPVETAQIEDVQAAEVPAISQQVTTADTTMQLQ